MTGTEPSTPLRAIYFDSPAEAVAGLTEAVRSGAGDQLHGALGRMPAAAQTAVLGQVGSAAAGLLELDLAAILGLAWGKYAALRRAAEETAADWDTEQLVGLANHRVSFAHEPSVQVHVGDLPVAEIALRLELELRIKGLLAVVRGGRLTAIRTGRCEVGGTLTVAGRQVAERQISVELPRALRLGKGIALLDAPPA
jgi:hypothetical protein